MRLLSVAVGASGVAVGCAVLAGPLNPPAGAVTSSGKTLTEIEPRRAITSANTPGDNDSLFKITQSGSYYLTGNVSGEPNKHGIEVVADNVTIDLNGFTLNGTQNAMDAIRSDGGPGQTGLTVRNGTITGWSNGSGVYAGAVAQCRVEDNHRVGSDYGLWVTGTGCVMVRNTCSGNTTTNWSIAANNVY